MTAIPVSLPHRTLGRSGITVPAVGIGCWAIGGPDYNLGLPMGWSTADDSESYEGLQAAWEMGARLFDTADVYGHGRSEQFLGQLVAAVPREELVLTSKVGYFTGTAEHGFEPGHMRRQLEQSLHNLRTDYLDIYFLHHSNFGPEDRWLAEAAEAMHIFQAEGLIRAIGMRGPHRYARDRLDLPSDQRHDKNVHFERVFAQIRPDVLAVRDNLLTPADHSDGVFTFAHRHNVGVIINKPLAQGLLTGSYAPRPQREFGPGDHRLRKRWFTPEAVTEIDKGLAELRQLVGPHREDLIHVAVWACLQRYRAAAVLTGFTRASHLRQNLHAIGDQPPPPAILTRARAIMARTQQRLNRLGEVFRDEQTTTAHEEQP